MKVIFGPNSPGFLAVDRVTRRFKGVDVLRDVTFSADPGAVANVVGPNGSGKTTLLRIIAGTVAADAGSVRVSGEPPGRGLASYVPAGDRALYWRLTASQNLEFFARLAGFGRSAREQAVGAAEAVGGAGLLSKRVGECSTGQRRRIMIARGLVGRSPVLLLDEPFADLDADGCRAVESVIRLWAEAGGSVLSASPDPDHGVPAGMMLRLDDGRLSSSPGGLR